MSVLTSSESVTSLKSQEELDKMLLLACEQGSISEVDEALVCRSVHRCSRRKRRIGTASRVLSRRLGCCRRARSVPAAKKIFAIGCRWRDECSALGGAKLVRTVMTSLLQQFSSLVDSKDAALWTPLGFLCKQAL
jgi:hypothetical protein